MKKILCYGDSNTYGFIPASGKRYDKDTRFCGILAKILSHDFEIIEEGMNNRTGFFKNPEGLKQSGGEYLSIYLQNHKDIDICILAVGTNDFQIFYNIDEEIIQKGLRNLITSVKKYNPNAQIIIIPPVKITHDILKSYFSMMFNRNSIEKIQKLFPIFEKTAQANNCLYYDFNLITKPSDTDGLHYTEEAHKLIAEHLSEFIKTVSI